VGNDDLDNESITAFEIGYRGQFLEEELTIEADAFLHLYRDTISFNVDIVTSTMGLPDLDNSKMIYTNSGREVNSAGGSLSLTYRIKGSLWASANYTYRYTWYISAPEEMAVVMGGKGDRLPWEPAHLANLSLHYLQEDGLRCGLSVHGASEHDLAMPENGGLFDDPVLVNSPPFLMVGGFLAWRVTFASGWFEGGVRAYNTFHQGFRDTQAVRRPDGVELGGELIGRQIFLFMRGRI
jgi:outer membrane receptor for ferrienterochelin and colicin